MFTLSTFYNSKRKINDKKVTRRFNDSMSSLSNAKKISIKHSSGLHPGDSLFHFHASKLILHIPDTFFFCIYITNFKMLIFFAFDNDDMESSKRRVAFLSSIFLLTRMSKLIVIRSTFYKAAKTQKQLLKLNAIQRFFLFFLARYIRILRVHIKSKDVVLEIKVISV